METLPFYKLNKTEFINTLETTNKYIKDKLSDTKFTKYIQAHIVNNHSVTNKCRYLNIDEIEDYLKKGNSKKADNIGTKSTNIVHFNIRSLDKHFGELLAFNEQTDNLFQYIALSEIGKKNIEPRKAMLKNIGCNLNYKLSHLSKGGVGLITKSETDIKIRSDLYFKNTEFSKINLTTESLWVEEMHTDAKKNFIIGVIYRHPGSTLECLEEFTEQLRNIIKKVESENKKIYIVGDLNIDGMKATSNKNVAKFFNMLLDNNYLPLITKPTRVQDLSISIIDHAIINPTVLKTECKIKAGVIYSGITDHLPIFLSIQEDHKVTPKVRPMIRLFSEKNKNKFYRLIKNCNWDDFEKSNSVSEALKMIYKNWRRCHEESFPLIKLSRTKAKQKPWLSAELIKAIKEKNKLYKLTSENPTSENKNKLSKLRNQVTSQIRKEHGKYYQNIINGEKQNIKKLWDLFAHVLNAKRNKEKRNIRELKVNNKSITNDKDIANALNEYFCNVGKNLASKHDDNYDNFKKYLGTPVQDTIDLKSTSTKEVFEVMRCLKKKSCGADDVHPKLLLRTRKIIAPVLAHFFNLCIEKREYPDLLKIAKVIPLFKKSLEDERNEPGNYRPISLLSAINKILEKIIHMRLTRFIVKNDILYKYQFGFRRSHSTTLALIDVVDNIRKNLHMGKKVAGVYIDFSKAFDTVNHDILVQKLEHYGISGNMLELLKSYLNNRRQYTVANGTESEELEINCGVPQGSVLGPLLFILYTNDIQNCTEHTLKLFADDTNGFIFEDNHTQLKKKIIKLLQNLFKWSEENKLTINTSKTCFSIFHRSKDLVPTFLNSVKIPGSPNLITIKREKVSKYLGLYLDEQISWEHHLNHAEDGLLAKLTKVNNSFKMVKHCIPEKNKKLIFNAYFLSKIQYGIELFGCADHKLIHKLQVKQNRALKILFNKDFYTPTKKLHADLNILTVSDIHKFTMAKFVYRQQNNKLPSIYDKHFTKVGETHGHTTRQQDLLKIENTVNKSTHSENTSTKIGAKIWNELPKEIREADKLYKFKNFCKVFYIDQYETDK